MIFGSRLIFIIGQVVSNFDQLLEIVHYGTGKVRGFIKEEQIERFLKKNPAVFIPNDGIHDKVYLVSKSLDLSAITNLPYISLSSAHDGPVAVRNFTGGKFQYRPETAHYIAEFDLAKKSEIQFELPGYVHIKGSRYSPFANLTKGVIAIIVRESGF